MSYNWGRTPYESVDHKRRKARKEIKILRKLGKIISPVVIEGKQIAESWWGKAWNKNLESYSDFYNRLSRGRSYVKHESVIDLQIEKGLVSSLVMGSGVNRYKCEIKITKLNEDNWENVKNISINSISTIEELLSGKFPESLKELFTTKGRGLFPAPAEISMTCTCPDSASLCKHLSATIYGIGNRLDTEPELLFLLRQVDSLELIKKVVSGQKDNLISRAAQVKSDRVIKMDDNDLSGLFGISLDD